MKIEQSSACAGLKLAELGNSWYNRTNTNSGSEEVNHDTVLFFPSTPSSSLATILRAHEAKNNQGRKSLIKIVEKAGISVNPN